jgi:aminoglycoside phosphotransferase (APT) family kinase protein
MNLSVVPASHHDLARTALRDAFADDVTDISVVTGGASGALTYKVTTPDGDHLLRLEANHGDMRNATQYECMRIAADAGIAPPVRYLDAAAGVVVMPFIEQRPIEEFGNPDAIAAATARLLAQLHATAPFPAHGDWLALTRRAAAFLGTSGRIAPGLLDAHIAALDEIVAAYPWDPSTHVSAHNDPNPANVLYDGKRLWLIDWETASRNDPFVDLAIAANNQTLVAEVGEPLLRAYFGDAVDDATRARLALMRIVVRFWAAVMLFALVADPAVPQHTDLDASSFGSHPQGTPANIHAFAKLMFNMFLDEARRPAAARARAILSA